tara:strand:- start:86 stop:1048 length:963 start_codon:yes stop_codon:yes gene_type:complete
MEIITRKDAQKKGQRYFYEGLVCDKGHKDYWLTKRNVCSVCRRIYEHEYAWKKKPIKHKYRPNFKFVCLWCENDFLINGTPKGFENSLFCSIHETYHSPKKTCSKKCNDALYNDLIYREKKRQVYKENENERFKRLNKNKMYRKNNEKFREKIKNYRKSYSEKNKDLINVYKKEWIAEKRENDLNFRILDNLRHRIKEAIKAGDSYKSEKTLELLGASIKQVKTHLEKDFSEGMNWDTRGGENGWDIDHVRPCNTFNLKNKNEQLVCFNWRNLQPLWANENRYDKNGKYTKNDERAWIRRMRDLGFEGQLFLKYQHKKES